MKQREPQACRKTRRGSHRCQLFEIVRKNQLFGNPTLHPPSFFPQYAQSLRFSLVLQLFSTHTVASSRRRGSKQSKGFLVAQSSSSPPRGGVDRNPVLAPTKGAHRGRLLAEAWIETPNGGDAVMLMQVASSRRRGSKQGHCGISCRLGLSPPRGGVDRNAKHVKAGADPQGRLLAEAWIETWPSPGIRS
jgi:hypothetical protein